MTKTENNLLLYLETRLVDHRGLVASAHMNAVDLDIAEAWSKSGFVGFGRRLFKDIEASAKTGTPSTHWVAFTDEAWVIVHQARRERAERHVHTLKRSATKDQPHDSRE